MAYQLVMKWSMLELATGPNSQFGSGSGSNLGPNHCDGFPHNTDFSKGNISCSNWVLEFSSYRGIIYKWNMQFYALFDLPFSDLQSDQ